MTDHDAQARAVVEDMKRQLLAEAERCRKLPGLVIPSEQWHKEMQQRVIVQALREAEARGWRQALERVAQDFHDQYKSISYSGSPHYVEVQAFLDSRTTHYPECRQEAQRVREGKP